MSELIDGTIDGWPVSIMIEHDSGGKIYEGHCCAYTNKNDEPASDQIKDKCEAITEATHGMSRRSVILARAKKLGFVEDK